MHCDEKANAGCANAGLSYVAEGYNVSRINGLIRDIAQPALDGHRARMRTRSDHTVLEFGTQPRNTELARDAGSPKRAMRVVFRTPHGRSVALWCRHQG
jgi:hypothetical protein